jgi:hypothetical protein
LQNAHHKRITRGDMCKRLTGEYDLQMGVDNFVRDLFTQEKEYFLLKNCVVLSLWLPDRSGLGKDNESHPAASGPEVFQKLGPPID